MTRVVVILALCASCVQSSEVTCDDGRVCPPNYTCDNANHRCLSPEQVNACDGLTDGADCTFSGAPGACHMGACEPLVCGDGLRSLGETCDGSDLGGADCTSAGFYNSDGLACTSFCTFDVSACTGYCGDNLINGDELCDTSPPQGACVDLGFDAGALACAASCGFSFATCGRFGWAPEPVGLATAYAFAGSSAADLWLVGEDTTGTGVIAHHDGTTWTRTSTNRPDKLVAAWAVSPSDAWIVSVPPGVGEQSQPLRWTGTQWDAVAAAPLAQYSDVWAASSSAVFFATRDAGVKWFDGASWQSLGALTGSIVEIRGASANDVWAVKADGTLAHWSGSVWMPVAVDVTVRHIAVLSPTSVWVVGPSTTSSTAAIAHWNGSVWTTYTDPSINTDAFTAIVAVADNDVWVAGPLAQARHFDGVRWTDSQARITTDPLAGVIAMRPFGDTIVAAASNGFVHRYRGQMFGRLNPASPNPALSLWSAGPNETFVGDLRGSVYRYNGATWTRSIIDTTTTSFGALFGSSPSDVWVSGASGRVHRWNGTAWAFQTALSGSVSSIWASEPNDVWFFGAGITHYDGTFTPVTLGATGFRAASGTGPSDIWALAPTGASTNVAHWNGSTWTVTSMPHAMTAIVALAPDDVFVTADTNHVLHYDGSTWSDTVVPISTPLEHIAASAHDDVVVASSTEAVHFDGTRWSPLRLTPEGFSTVEAIGVAPGYIDFLYGGSSGQFVKRLIRTRFWSCRASETACTDGVDDDCDGKTDALDTDC